MGGWLVKVSSGHFVLGGVGPVTRQFAVAWGGDSSVSLACSWGPLCTAPSSHPLDEPGKQTPPQGPGEWEFHAGIHFLSPQKIQKVQKVVDGCGA